jgi:hypothetical protein
MPLSDDDFALVRDALFAYGLANADTARGMRAQELYRLLKDATEFRLAREQQQEPRAALAPSQTGARRMRRS